MAKVSVVIPIYNVEQYLDKALESIKRQTLKDIEIICVNDGSKDNSLDIIKKWAQGDERFVIIDKENGGYGVAMNTGIDRATGEYIGILEPDDFVPLHMFEDLYNVAAENDLDFVKADFYRFVTNDENGNVRMTYNHLDKTGEYYNTLIDPSTTPEITKFIMNTWSGIYKREFLNKYNIRHNTTPGASFQDNGFFWQTTIRAKRAMFIDKPYYLNRRDNPNSSVNSKEKVYAMNVEYDYIRNILMDDEDPQIWERFKAYYNLKRFNNYMFTLRRIADEYKREYVNRISEEFRRSLELGEINIEIFNEKQQDEFKLLIENPKKFYSDHMKKLERKRSLEAVSKVDQIKNSSSYKIGRVITYIPRKIKRIVKR